MYALNPTHAIHPTSRVQLWNILSKSTISATFLWETRWEDAPKTQAVIVKTNPSTTSFAPNLFICKVSHACASYGRNSYVWPSYALRQNLRNVIAAN